MRIDELKIGIIDLETTGLSAETDRVVEVAFVPVVNGKIEKSDMWPWFDLHDPRMPIPASASAIHHIIDEDVSKEGVVQFAADYFFLASDVCQMDCYAAHNAAFDSGFLGSIPKPMICTMRLAQKLWQELESYGNQFLRYHLKLKPPVERHEPMHRALPDALVTATLLIHELNEIVSRCAEKQVDTPSLEYLIQWIAEPMLLTTVRFGKHKGSKWSEVPKDYLRWIRDKFEDADADTIHTAKFYLN